MIKKGFDKEFDRLANQTRAWVPVELEDSQRLRTSVPERILRPRPVRTHRNQNDKEEVKCRCTLQGFKDPDILQLVRDGKTASPTLSTNRRALIRQKLASCRFTMTIGDVKAAFFMADHEERPNSPIYVTMPKEYVMEGMHAEQLFEVRNGYGLGDQPQQWWRTFDHFPISELDFEQHPMDPCVFMLRKPVMQGMEEKLDDSRIAIVPLERGHAARSVCGRPGDLCGVLGVHVDDQINGGRSI